MIESVRNGVSIGSFCRFIMRNFQIPDFEPSIVINPTELQKFYEMTSFKSFHVKIARIEHGTIFNKGKKAIAQITNASKDTNNDILEYKLSVRKKHDSLARPKVRSWISALLKYKDSNEVQVLKVSGREEDDGILDSIDFIEQKLREKISVKTERLISRFEINEHYQKMMDVYHVHRKGLEVYKTNFKK